MKQFLNVSDIGDLKQALQEARQVKQTPFAWQHLGKNKTNSGVLQQQPPYQTQQPEGRNESRHECYCSEYQWRELET